MKKVVVVVLIAFSLFFGLFGGFLAKDILASSKDFAVYATFDLPVSNWDPNVEFSNGIITFCNIYETLLKYDPLEDRIIPVLATEYEKSEDNLSWTFTLRQGVKFHDGTDFNAEAVKYSIDRTMRINKGAAYIWEAVEEVQVVDDYTVKFVLKYPAPIDIIATSTYAAFIVSPTALKPHPDNWLSETGSFAVGTGPYKLESYKEGEQEVVLTWFEDYWGGWEGKHIKKALIKTVAEPVTRHMLIQSGEADFTMGLSFEDIKILQQDPNVNVWIGPSLQNTRICMNTLKEPLSNKKVRQALSCAFPYQDVITYAFEGHGEQSIGPIPVGLWGHLGDKKYQYQYDLNKAKKLLEEAGYPNGGFKLLLVYASARDTQREMAELFKAELAKLNIDLEIRGMAVQSGYALARRGSLEDRQDLFVNLWWPDYASPVGWLVPNFRSEEEPSANISYYSNPEYDALVDKGVMESGISREVAKNTFIDAQKLLVEDVPEIWTVDHTDIFFTHKDFKGYKDNMAYSNVVFFYETYKE